MLMPDHTSRPTIEADDRRLSREVDVVALDQRASGEIHGAAPPVAAHVDGSAAELIVVEPAPIGPNRERPQSAASQIDLLEPFREDVGHAVSADHVVDLAAHVTIDPPEVPRILEAPADDGLVGDSQADAIRPEEWGSVDAPELLPIDETDQVVSAIPVGEQSSHPQRRDGHRLRHLIPDDSSLVKVVDEDSV